MGKKTSLTLREMALFAMLGAVMFISKKLMEWAPNIHLVGAFIITFTLVYKVKALIPIYIYVFLDGLIVGFSPWWIPYLYIWAVLWGLAMLIPKRLTATLCVIVCSALCFLHGLGFGVLYAPAQAIMYGMNFKTTLAWIASGFPFDVMHALGNLAASLIIIPLAALLCRLEHKEFPYKK